MKEFDIFINNTIYPDAESVFNISVTPLDKIKSKCIFVIDTNALLLPYTTSSQSLEEIKKVFAKLKNQGRLIIPGQVAREFANNRPEKLKEIFQKLNRKRSEIQSLNLGKYPLLDGIKEYQELLKTENKINELLEAYRKSISTVVDTVRAWTWNDPVSSIYKDLFTKDTIHDLVINEEEIRKELGRRYLHKIPPGFKDDNKPDEGIGDLLIWLTILEIAKKKKDVVFVSGDEKSDWYHRSEKQALYPRFELVNEFKHHSKNKSFHIIKLFELLNLLGADDKAIKEVEIEERISSVRYTSHNSFMEFQRKCETAVMDWLLDKNDDMAIQPQDFGFPDFIMLHDDKTKTGVEVLTLSSNRGVVIMRLRDKLMRAYYEVNEGKFNKFMFVFVAPDSKISIDETLINIERMRSSFNDKKLNFTYVIGYLNEKEEFVETKKHDSF